MALADAVSSAVAAWSMDEASGTRVDSVGSNDLTDNNTVGSAAGTFGTAADFEAGNSEYLSVADSAAVSMGDIDFMIRGLFKPETLSTSNPFAKDDVGGDREWGSYYDATANRLKFYVFSPGGTFTEVAADNAGALSIGTTYLLHCWHDATNNVIGIAVNAGTANTAAHTLGVKDGAAAFTLGARANPIGNYWDGLLEDFVILKNYILDSTERTEDYNAGAGVAFADWAGGGGAVRRYSMTLTGVG